MNHRLLEIKKIMFEKNVDAIIISSVANITYLTGYSGFSMTEKEAYLLITKNENYLLTDGRYIGAVKNIPNFILMEITPVKPLHEMLVSLAKKHKVKKIGIEENNLTVSEYKMLKKHYNDTYHYSEIASLRAIKDNQEIKSIEQACTLGDKTFEYIIKKIKKGVTEKELAFEIEFFIKKANADISFRPIVAFGKNAAIPHHLSGDEKLSNNQFVLLDFGVKLNNYCSDMTRTIFYGKANAEQKKMYQTVLQAQQKSIEVLTSDGGRLSEREGHDSSEVDYKLIKASNVDKAARNYIIEQGYPTISHSVGHGTGLEIHESPSISPKSDDILKEGMVFSIEPGIYIPDFGGVRIEDLVVLEPSSPHLLTKSPRNLIEL